jgi:hypothetical protein|tara:strand:+ start:1324 stop:1521 length:198 start_codon:yes stop_codon:yes gene_type:complete
MKGGLIDKILNKLISRKLLVWLTATGLMYAELGITSEDWVAVSLVYIGMQGLTDFAAQWKHGDNN